MEHTERAPLPVAAREVARSWGTSRGKRAFDVAFASLVLVALAPVFAVIVAMIKATTPGPLFYRGTRVGWRGREFRIYKFRTMVAEAERRGGTSTPADDPRITSVGARLRKWKLDELPQFINVLLGDMSVVGPRPQVRWAVALYTDDERRLLSVRPGVTDWASIRFRNEADILRGSPDPDRAYLELIAPEKIRLGLHYVDTQSLSVDLAIIAATIRNLL